MSETKQAESISKHETTHSELPWAQSHRRGKDGMYRTEVYSPDGEAICVLNWVPQEFPDGVTGTRRAPNARLIVTAVNFHERLKDALRLMCEFGERQGWEHVHINQARALLSEISKAAE